MQFPIGSPLDCSLYRQSFSRHCTLTVLGSRFWPFMVTWRNWSPDHLIPHIPFPIGRPWGLNTISVLSKNWL